MRLLFIGNTHLNLYIDITEEMERQGYRVTFVPDYVGLFDTNFHKKIPIPLSIKNRLWHFFLEKKWKKIFRTNDAFKEGFDVLFVLSGLSVCEELINMLKRQNPTIKTVLYTWDPCSAYPFNRMLPLFDKAFTFDIHDCQKDSRWSLLPIYYKEGVPNVKPIYDIFSVGSNRVGRYSFISKILPQLRDAGLTFYIKIVAPKEKRSIKGRLFSFLFLHDMTQEEKETDDFLKGKVHPEILLRQTIRHDEYDRLSSMSQVVLDDQKDGQTGLTARFMWAIGNHKRIISTNRHVFDYSFVNTKIVSVIDVDNPIIPIDFIKKELKEEDWPDIRDYRIDNWLKCLLA